MKNRPDTPEGVEELRQQLAAHEARRKESIMWCRETDGLRRVVTIHPQTLTPEQQSRLKQIEDELLSMADDATEESKRTLIP